LWWIIIREYICILNPDTVVAEDTFSLLLKFADNIENLGIVGCRLIDGNGDYLPESKRNVPTPKVSFNKIFGSGDLYYANYVNEKEIGKVDVLVGAFMLMKREIYRKRFYEAMHIFYGKHFKKNLLLGIMIKLGTKMMPLFESSSSKKTHTGKEGIILDNNKMSFKEIISSFENQDGPFKIRPKNSNFIIGSSGSKMLYYGYGKI